MKLLNSKQQRTNSHSEVKTSTTTFSEKTESNLSYGQNVVTSIVYDKVTLKLDELAD